MPHISGNNSPFLMKKTQKWSSDHRDFMHDKTMRDKILRNTSNFRLKATLTKQAEDSCLHCAANRRLLLTLRWKQKIVAQVEEEFASTCAQRDLLLFSHRGICFCLRAKKFSCVCAQRNLFLFARRGIHATVQILLFLCNTRANINSSEL